MNCALAASFARSSTRHGVEMLRRSLMGVRLPGATLTLRRTRGQSMDWETIKAWVEQYGYLAVGLGTLIDQSGLQSFVVAGGVLAGVESRISLLGVILAGAAGSFTSDAPALQCRCCQRCRPS
jgi:hypothetical protein